MRTELALPASTALLVVTGHPDDETIGAGRLIAEAAATARVRCVTLSAGEACFDEPRFDEPDVEGLGPGGGVDRDALGAQRLEEWRTAVRTLGGEAVETPRWPDGVLGEHEEEIEALVWELLHPGEVLVTTWRHDPHPDHQAVGRAVAAAAQRVGARLVEFPVWAPWWSTGEDLLRQNRVLRAVDLSERCGELRTAALRQYASQLQPFRPGWEPIVPDQLLALHERQLLVVPVEEPLDGEPEANAWDATYAENPDPFEVGSSWYERRKAGLVMATLGRERYALAWDCACGPGYLAEELAAVSDRVLATDASKEAVALAAVRTKDLAPVSTAVSALPEVPDEVAQADLVVVAEVLYYLDDHARAQAVVNLAGMGAEVVGVNWRHHPDDAYVSGADALAELDEAMRAAGRVRACWHDERDFVLASWDPVC